MKKLIIVCEDALKKYGDFLSQLISLIDDKDESVVGVKDGTVAAQVWTEKEYNANAAQISSEQYIVFIGNNKLMQKKRSFMPIKFSQYGMKYGWLGKQGAIYVDKVISSADEYYNFIEFAGDFQPKIKNLISKKSIHIEKPSISWLPDTKNRNNRQNQTRKRLSKLPDLVGNKVASITESGERTMNRVRKEFTLATKNKKIEDQEYSCLILLFYLQGLARFLGLDEAVNNE